MFKPHYQVLGLGSNYRVQAVSVSRGDSEGLEPVYRYATTNTMPHITVSLARFAYPSDSNKMLQKCATGVLALSCIYIIYSCTNND